MSTSPLEVSVGLPAPDFVLEAHDGVQVRLSERTGQKHVVLYFMREFACMQCQRLSVELARSAHQFDAKEVEILVIGGGRRKDAERLKRVFSLPFTVLADPDRAVYMLYGLPKVFLAIQRSGTFLIDRDGVVRYIHQTTNPQASVNVDELLREVEALSI